MTLQLEIDEKVDRLAELRSKAVRMGRELNDKELNKATALMNDIQLLERVQRGPDRTPVDTRLDDFAPYNGLRESEGYELRRHDQSKSWTSLFGKGKNDYRWTDKSQSFMGAVVSGRHHPDLIERAMNEGTPSDGGFLVPSETSKQIHTVALEDAIVLPRATVIPTTSNELILPGFDIGDHSSNLFGGFTASYKGEAATLAEANPKARAMTLNMYKLTGFLRYSNELKSDMIGGEKKLIEVAGKGLGWYRDKAFLKGSGAGQPLGILNGNDLIAVAKESGQSADSITYENLTEMMSRMHPASFGKSIWVCHQTTIPSLLQLSLSVGTGGSVVPVMNETDGQFTILTRPVLFTEKTEPIGDQGDILLADFSQYAIGMREEMRIDTSLHTYFTTDESAMRLIERHDGQSLWGEALTLLDGTNTVSPFVTLAERV